MRKQILNNTLLLLLAVVILFFINACEKSFDWDYIEEDSFIPVVEGIITNENITQKIHLSLVRSNPNEAPVPITDAQVSVTILNTFYNFLHDTANPGTYTSAQPFIGVVDIPVELQVRVGEVLYTASDIMIPVTPTQKAQFRQVNNPDSLFELVSPGSTFTSNEPAMWMLEIDWSFLPAYQNVNPDSCKARLFYYSLKTIDVSEVFAPDRQNQYFPEDALVKQTKYALSAEHAEFRRSLLLETEWRGGYFDVSPGMVYSNLKGGAMGFFGACSVVETTYTVKSD